MSFDLQRRLFKHESQCEFTSGLQRLEGVEPLWFLKTSRRVRMWLSQGLILACSFRVIVVSGPRAGDTFVVLVAACGYTSARTNCR
jgi:hypothetical protein